MMQEKELGGQAQPGGALGLRVLRPMAPEEQIAEARRQLDEFLALDNRQWNDPYDGQDKTGFTWPLRQLTYRDVLKYGGPQPGLPQHVNEWRIRNLPKVLRGFAKVLWHRATPGFLRMPTMYGTLWLNVIRANGAVEPYGLASMNLVTTAGVNALVDAWQATFTLNNFKFHGIGTGTNAEATGDTALQTESTTALNPDSTRATGTTIDGSSANIIRSVGTVTVDATVANTEHGLLSQAATGGGTLWDRSVYSVVNLASGDSLQATYDGTFPAGG